MSKGRSYCFVAIILIAITIQLIIYVPLDVHLCIQISCVHKCIIDRHKAKCPGRKRTDYNYSSCSMHCRVNEHVFVVVKLSQMTVATVFEYAPMVLYERKFILNILCTFNIYI